MDRPWAVRRRARPEWVAPGGTLLIVGHRHVAPRDDHGQLHAPPAEARVTAPAITARLDPAAWRIDAADEYTRSVPTPRRDVVLDDVVVRATRRA